MVRFIINFIFGQMLIEDKMTIHWSMTTMSNVRYLRISRRLGASVDKVAGRMFAVFLTE
jgi:hypothetical protein